jgi:hypothetical protein
VLLGRNRCGFAVFRGLLRLSFANRCALGKTGDAQILCFPPESVEVKDQRLTRPTEWREIDHAAPCELPRRRVAPYFGASANELGGQIGFDAVRDHVDHPANRVAAVKQGGGPANHFDPLDEQWLDTHRVVRTGDRRVERAHAIFEQTDSVTGQAADDRPARAWPERRRAHAGFGGERFAQTGLLFQPQRLVAEHGGGLREIDLVAREGSR